MTVRVFKYEIPVTDHIEIEMPTDAQILTVQTQGEKVCLWARVDDSDDLVKRRFRIAGTGHEVNAGRYISTFQLYGGQLVFHVFEELT